MKFKREHFRVDYETLQKINLLCDCLKISKSKLFLMGIEKVYNEAVQPDGAVKDVKKSVSSALMSIAIYLNSEEEEEEDLSDLYKAIKSFMDDMMQSKRLKQS